MSSLTVVPGDPPARLDVFLAQQLPNCSRRSAQRAIAAGTVRINGRRARKGQPVVGGDVIEFPNELVEERRLQPNPTLVIKVLYEDAALIAIDKPAGTPSHALRADETGTAANFLLAHYPEVAAVGKSDREAGIVHRLDTDTSGVLLATRARAAYRSLRQQFATHHVTKDYVALVHGSVPRPGRICAPIVHDRRNRRRMIVCSGKQSAPHARLAITDYRPVEHIGNHTVLAVRIATGGMHQVRVHLAFIGHPLVGDSLYGGCAAAPGPRRHLLHAVRLRFTHPITGTPTIISSLLPADFAAFLNALRKDAGPQPLRRQPPGL
ncbi:MAG: RluA family pseudouridine synthase [Candidatus Binatia bacterium]